MLNRTTITLRMALMLIGMVILFKMIFFFALNIAEQVCEKAGIGGGFVSHIWPNPGKRETPKLRGQERGILSPAISLQEPLQFPWRSPKKPLPPQEPRVKLKDAHPAAKPSPFPDSTRTLSIFSLIPGTCGFQNKSPSPQSHPDKNNKSQSNLKIPLCGLFVL